MTADNKNHKLDEDLKLLIWELRDNPYRRFLVAFLLVWAIPFLALLYLALLVRNPENQVSQAQFYGIIFLIIFIAIEGYLVAHQMLRHILDKLVAYFVRAKRQDELKSRFVATVSHELKSPLMVLRTNFSNQLAGFAGPLSEEQALVTQSCQKVIDRMDQLIHDILDLYKIESGMVDLKKAPCDAADLLRAQLAELNALFKEREIHLVIKIPEKPFPAELDAAKITCVFNNLLSNALKYTPVNGEITVSLELIGGYLKVEILNTGDPIPREHLETIFDRFEKLDPEKEGYGLGLAIARDIIEAHGGRIWAENRGVTKNCFVIYLPPKGKK